MKLDKMLEEFCILDGNFADTSHLSPKIIHKQQRMIEVMRDALESLSKVRVMQDELTESLGATYMINEYAMKALAEVERIETSD